MRGKENTLLLEVERRKEQKPGCTLGELRVNGNHVCWTLEDQVREPVSPRMGLTADAWVRKWKVQDETAIPRGEYSVIISESAHFGKKLPEILNVPGFSGVRIHSGNSAKDTEGCILLGQTIAANLVYGSHAAFKEFLPLLQAALATGEKVTLKVF